MTKLKHYWIYITVIFVLLPLITWQLKDITEMNIIIINKTVPDNLYREHRGLFWIINNNKIVKTDTRDKYNYTKDYYGILPLEYSNYKTKELVSNYNYSDDKNIDLIYVADTYGI